MVVKSSIKRSCNISEKRRQQKYGNNIMWHQRINGEKSGNISAAMASAAIV